MKKINNQGLILPLLVASILIGAVYAVYMYMIAPKLDEKNRLEVNNIALTEDAEVLQQQLVTEKNQAAATAKSDVELHMKVPAQRELAQLIKQIEQFEGLSNVVVSNVAFNNYDTEAGQQFSEQQSEAEQQNTAEAEQQATEAVATETENTTTEGTIEENADAEKIQESDEGKATPITSLDYASLPNNIKLVTVSMTISAMEESEVLAFLKRIEKSTRLIRVDSIDYTEENPEQTEQQTNEEQEAVNYPVNAVVQMTTFYEQGSIVSE